MSDADHAYDAAMELMLDYEDWKARAIKAESDLADMARELVDCTEVRLAEHAARLKAEAALSKAEYELQRWKNVAAQNADWEKLWQEKSNQADKAEAECERHRFKAARAIDARLKAEEALQRYAREALGHE